MKVTFKVVFKRNINNTHN